MVETVSGLDMVLDKLTVQARDAPFIVNVELANGDSLGIGLGTDETILSFTAGSLEAPYFASLGADEQVEPLIEFTVGGQWTEFPRRNVVPLEEGRQAMREFVTTGQLSDAVRWEEV